MQHQIPFKHIFWSNKHLSIFFWNLWRQSNLYSNRVFPFFHFIFLLKRNKQKIFKTGHEKGQKQSPQPATLFNRDFATGILLWILWNFYEHLFWKNAYSLTASERWKIVKPITLQRNFFTQITGNRVSDHNARNVYIKVFL